MNRLTNTSFLWIVLFVFVGAMPTTAREVSGLVRDKVTGAPLVSALVKIAETGSVALTDAQGRYYFPNIPEGDYTVLIGKTGYVPSVMGAVSIRPSCCQIRVGNANGLGTYPNEVTISDIQTLVNAKFIQGTCTGLVPCIAEGDVNQSGGANPTCNDITIADISTLVNHLFIAGPVAAPLKSCL